MKQRRIDTQPTLKSSLCGGRKIPRGREQGKHHVEITSVYLILIDRELYCESGLGKGSCFLDGRWRASRYVALSFSSSTFLIVASARRHIWNRTFVSKLHMQVQYKHKTLVDPQPQGGGHPCYCSQGHVSL